MSRPSDAEIYKYHKVLNDQAFKGDITPLLKTVNWAMDQALEGMIPAASAIQIPPESEWPVKADCIQVAYYDADGEYILNGTIKLIHRSKPQWAPKDGESVLFLAQGGLRPSIGVIAKGKLWVGKNSFGINEFPIKPFDSEKLDTSWDQI